jgi:hypothetical protein
MIWSIPHFIEKKLLLGGKLLLYVTSSIERKKEGAAKSEKGFSV